MHSYLFHGYLQDCVVLNDIAETWPAAPNLMPPARLFSRAFVGFYSQGFHSIIRVYTHFNIRFVFILIQPIIRPRYFIEKFVFDYLFNQALIGTLGPRVFSPPLRGVTNHILACKKSSPDLTDIKGGEKSPGYTIGGHSCHSHSPSSGAINVRV